MLFRSQGIKLEDYLKYLGQSMEEFRKQFVSQATPRVMSQLVVEKIVREEKIEASQEEIDAKIAEQAASVEKSAEDYKKSMDPRQVEYIKNDIVITKLFDMLKANNELYAEDAEPAKQAAKKPAAKKTASTAKKTAKKAE